MKPIYKVVFFVSISLIIVSVAALFMLGLKLGVDFTGGSEMEVAFKDRPEINNIKDALTSFPELTVNISGDSSAIIRTRELSEEGHQSMLNKLQSDFGVSNVTEK